MAKEAALAPNELREPSDEDELVTSSIYPNQITSSVEPCNQSIKSWIGPVQHQPLTNLPECISFITTYGCPSNRSPTWARRTLDRFSLIATPQQLDDILNGYADLYRLVLYLIQYSDNVPIIETSVRSFGGTSSNIKQQERHRRLAYIMFDSKKFLFAPLYAIHTDGYPQTYFTSDDEFIVDHIVHFVRQRNYEISRLSASEIDLTSDNEDATKNVEADSLDALLPSESIVQNETSPTTLSTNDDDIQHTSFTTAQADVYSDNQGIITTSTDSAMNDFNLSSGIDLIKERVHQNNNHIEECLIQARRLCQEVDCISSMETDDRKCMTNEALSERGLISQHVVTNMRPRKTQDLRKHARSSIANRSSTVICLSQSTTAPPPTMSNVQIRNMLPQDHDPPRVTRQPKRHRRVRMMNDLANKECSLVQGGEGNTQRVYPEIEVPEDDGDELYIRVRVVTENRYPHPIKTAAPENAHVDFTLMKDNNERLCLQYPPDSYDPENECVYALITTGERRDRRKLIKVRLFKWKQCGSTTKQVIEQENLRLCRLEFHLCQRVNTDQYKLVSWPSYSSVIEDMDGDVTIDPAKIEPKQLCELGGEKVIVPLSVQCPKKGFGIECNGNELNNKEFTMERKKLLFTSPPKTKGNNHLHLVIKRTEFVENTSDHKINELYNDYLPYIGHHDLYVHNCSQPVLLVINNQT